MVRGGFAARVAVVAVECRLEAAGGVLRCVAARCEAVGSLKCDVLGELKIFARENLVRT